MFFGQGFDTDGDGENDIFVGGRVDAETQKFVGQFLAFILVGGFLAFLGHGLKVWWDGFVASGGLEATKEGASWLFWSTVSVVFWGTMTLLCIAAVVVMVIGILHKEKEG